MNIIFLCRWKLEDVLTASTVLPHLQALVQFSGISKIIFITLEDAVEARAQTAAYPILKHLKINWLPFLASRKKSRMINQIADYRTGYKRLKQIVKEENIQLVIAHGAPAGAVADKALKGTKTPYYVTLFEPHADYMRDSGVWRKYGPKYMMQKYWESLQKKNATGLMPVSEEYRKTLIKVGVLTEKICVVSCSVRFENFRYDVHRREEIRWKLGWSNAVIGIYVGKYGGLYYQEEAFEIYNLCFHHILNFRLIILSPQPKKEIMKYLHEYQVDISKVHINSVQHHDVPAYLSAADFAFATYKPGASKRYLSPVKIGEYWANGLPVLLTEGIGDDSDIIQNEGGGATFNLSKKNSLEHALQKIKAILADPNHRQEIPKLAVKYRSPDKIREAYEYFFNRLNQQGP